MKTPLVLGVVALVASLGVLRGVSQASIVTITADTSSSGGITANGVAPFDMGLTSVPIVYQLGTISIPSNVSSGSLVWNVDIDGVVKSLAQSITVSNGSVAIGDSSLASYQLPGGVSWDVYAVGLTVPESASEMPVYGSFVDSLGPPIPEPSTVLVWSGLGAVGLIAAWRRRKRAA